MTAMTDTPANILFADLNNFAHYPTIPVGLLTAALRQDGHHVRLFSPLASGIEGFSRQRQAKRGENWLDLLRLWSGMTHSTTVRNLREQLRKATTPRSDDVAERIVSTFKAALAEPTDAVLISTYTMYFGAVQQLAAECQARGIPCIVGGPSFNVPAIQAKWASIPGVSAVVGGEPEAYISALVRAAIAGEALDCFPGVGGEAPPVQDLSHLPIPDYSDFPWDRYPLRILPIMTARGCGWGVCQFCSDVTTVMGRGFRSRRFQRVEQEIATLAERHNARHMVFHDLKLNSDLDVWHGLLDRMPAIVPGAVWTAAVHVGNEPQNGLSLDELKAARAAGLARITTGLESGSQRMLNTMGKGTRTERIAQFCYDASQADLSVRLTTIVGYPDETTGDLMETARFLEDNSAHIERVMVNRFTAMLGTPVTERLQNDPARFEKFDLGEPNLDEAIVSFRNRETREPGYFRALRRVLNAAHRINRRPLSDHAMAFEGVM